MVVDHYLGHDGSRGRRASVGHDGFDHTELQNGKTILIYVAAGAFGQASS